MKVMETKERNTRFEKMHWDSQQWKSKFHLMQDEISFIENLLNSYVFEPNTPNLFEKLQNYKQLLKKVIENKEGVERGICKHEYELGGLLERKDSDSDLTYGQSHELLEIEVQNCLSKFQDLKREVFNYAGGILKKRKP